jgi:predicted HD superfamily hydrolase involved in NAD metabolism
MTPMRVQPSSTMALPDWAQVTEKRRGHIVRVTTLLDTWATAMRVDDEERSAWHDAGLWHDALKDAPEEEQRALVGASSFEPAMLHGPAAAALLEGRGERRRDVLDAIRFHTVGSTSWARTGRALYMADFLEPGRNFSHADRGFLARQVPHDFAGVFRQVVRMRIEWTVREGHTIFPETVQLWNAVR